jgi:hypothetical protein
MLLGMLAVGVPVLFHMLRKKRVVPKKWAAFHFLHLSENKARQVKVEKWLLLALRMALVALFVLAFSRPGGYLGLLAGGTGKGKYIALLLDNSASMGAKVNDVPMFELARKRLIEHLSRLDFDRGMVVFMADRPRQPFKGFTSDRNALIQAVEQARLSEGGTDANAALRHAVTRLFATDARERVILLYSDFQRSSWNLDDLKKLNEELAKKELKLALVHIHTEEEKELDNQTIAHVEIGADVVTAGQEVPFYITFHNHYAGERIRSFSLFVDGQKRHQQDIVIPPAESFTPGTLRVSVQHTFPSEGYHSGRVEIDPDANEADNRRYFALEVVRKIRTLIVDGDPRLEAVKSESFYLQKLLATDVSKNIAPTIVPVWGLDKVSLMDYDVFLFANVNKISAEKFSELKVQIQRGAGLLYFLGDRVYPEDFKATYTLATGKARDDRLKEVPEGIFPGYPWEALGEASDHSRSLSLDPARASFDHPLLAKFRGVDLSAAKFYRIFKFRAIDPTSVPLRYTNGYPALLERVFGNGRTLIFTSACDLDWNNFIITGSTAPLVLQAIYYCYGTGRNRALNRTVGERIAIRFPFGLFDKAVIVTAPDGRTINLRSRASRKGDCRAILPDAERAGLYRFAMEGGPAGAVAVNPDPEESVREAIDPDEVDGILSNVDVWVEEEELLGDGEPLGADGWLALIFLGIACLCVEAFLANKNL